MEKTSYGIVGYTGLDHGGGGGGSQPGPNTVGTEQIIDGAVEMRDLNQRVKDEMITKSDHVTDEELSGFDV